MIFDIIDELNYENGSKYKLSVLEKHKSNDLFKRVLLMTYDRVKYTYGIHKLPSYRNNGSNTYSLNEALDFLENKLNTRELTGHSAINALVEVLSNLSVDDAVVVERVIGRDLKINIGKTQINKVFSGLVTKPPYMRCGVYSNDTSKKISFPAIIQLKADGMFQYLIKNGESISFIARSGEEREFPILKDIAMQLPDGVFVGEFLVDGSKDRGESNGLINSDNPPHDRIIMKCWDMVSIQEYLDGKHTNKSIKRDIYLKRFDALCQVLSDLNSDKMQVIDYKEVSSISEALEITSEWMNAGYEGGVLKDYGNVFKDHTSPTQLKLKLEIDADVRVTGFVEGTKGTKREKTFGSITYVNDEGTVVGQCSGFTDAELEKFNSMRDELIGKVITVKFNDITKAKNSDTYALSHPRFVEVRYDKNDTDTLERMLESKKMAMQLK